MSSLSKQGEALGLRRRVDKIVAVLSVIAAALLFVGIPTGGDVGQAQAAYTRM